MDLWAAKLFCHRSSLWTILKPFLSLSEMVSAASSTPDGNFSKASTGKSNGMHPCNIPHPDLLSSPLSALFSIFSLDELETLFLSTHQSRVFARYCDPVSFHSSRFTRRGRRRTSSHIYSRPRDESQGWIADTWNITLSCPFVWACTRATYQSLAAKVEPDVLVLKHVWSYDRFFSL